MLWTFEMIVRVCIVVYRGSLYDDTPTSACENIVPVAKLRQGWANIWNACTKATKAQAPSYTATKALPPSYTATKAQAPSYTATKAQAPSYQTIDRQDSSDLDWIHVV